jgi:hypothetical protein
MFSASVLGHSPGCLTTARACPYCQDPPELAPDSMGKLLGSFAVVDILMQEQNVDYEIDSFWVILRKRWVILHFATVDIWYFWHSSIRVNGRIWVHWPTFCSFHWTFLHHPLLLDLCPHRPLTASPYMHVLLKWSTTKFKILTDFEIIDRPSLYQLCKIFVKLPWQVTCLTSFPLATQSHD